MERKKPRISSKREHPIEVILLRVNLGHADFVAGYKEWREIFLGVDSAQDIIGGVRQIAPNSKLIDRDNLNVT